jgi:hypothetical protein
MKRYYFIVYFLISYFTFSQSEIRNVFAISTNHFGHNFNLNEKDSVVLLYDALGNIVEEKYYEVGSFVDFSFRKIKKYNQTKIIQSIELLLNRQLNLWDTVFKRDYYYASNDSLEKVISSKKSNNIWRYTQISEFHFDEQNRITAQVESDWNCLTNKFIAKHKESFKYNKKNQIVQINRQVCNLNGVWLNTGKDSITYENGLKVENYSFYFDDSDRGVWLKTSKETISYDTLNNHYQTLIQHWLPEQNKFVTNEYTRLITSHYNQKNQLNFINDKIFNPSLKRFEDYEQKFYY